MEITAAVLTESQKEFKIQTVELEEPRADEILVKIVATGLCHTDIAVRDQQLPFPTPGILGHEGAGIVEKVGVNVTKVKAGDHVILAPGACGVCEQCISGHPSYCESFFTLNFSGKRPDGSSAHHSHGKKIGDFFFNQSSFATYALTDQRSVVKVSKDVDIALMGPLGCGIQTGAGTVLNVARPNVGDTIAVTGVGPVGLSAIMAAKAAGCSIIIAIDINDDRLAFAKDLGATDTVNSKTYPETAKYIRENIAPAGLHHAVDTTAINPVINQLVKAMKVNGTVYTVGVMKAGGKLEIDYMPFSLGISIKAVVEGDSLPDLFIPKLIQMYQDGIFPFDKMVKFYTLDQINEAVEDAEKGKTLKAIIRMPD
ncbi:Aryl-alcohol dehydrogenase [Sphingobacterium multivorum]|uniref:NAD(P)-dependent alcohol dehydrogenase n=1 Tax=Sphingobacterium multivorum TaxID=28454 RepID=UPI000DFCD591|nr:NAD(P)-dependent alcohol dehydrogenase [Sphingobacterium multivorum]QQT46635.1 NAD(P)-dependent alcohol dehydrogenase [Sphingobacterium multivorum]SUJ89348.1 Aryl-alcohol dehydrogenase [Sphingobacterium multivorum]